MIFDSHAHYDDSAFDEDRCELLDSLPSKNVSGVLNVGSDPKSSLKCLEIARDYSFVFASVGVHPQNVSDLSSDFLSDLGKLIENKEVVAVGEIGLDYSRNFADAELQKKVFLEQISLAKDFDLPIIVHSRDASLDMIEILKKTRPRGVVHCFSGDLEFAETLFGIGFRIGVGGVLTFKNSKKLAETIKKIPIEKILLETDAPYLAPVPVRGGRCDSSYIKYTGAKLAEIKDMPLGLIFEITKNNAFSLFDMSLT
ncbi:MAG: TatD family hydrolase [Oscillospiraceae bacterium]|jgi:TatD DNase family protein|nr:TatD family hydrolase [Oscillospiraceae bacterium]